MHHKVWIWSLFTIGFLSITASPLSAQSVNIVSTSVPFLRVSPDARAGAMADAGLALSPDANATFWNSAKSVFAQSNSQLGLTYTPWLKDIAQDVYLVTAAGYTKINDNQAVTGGIRYFNLGQMQLTDASGNLLQNTRPKEFSLEAGFNQKITDVLSAGVTFRYINSNLVSGAINGSNYKAGTAFAGDISIFYNNLNENGAGVTAALTASNLGSKISYTNDAQSKQFIPANLGIGIANTWVLDDLSKFTGTINANHLLVPSYPSYTNSDGSTLTDAQQDAYDKSVADYYSYGVFQSWSKSFSNKAYSMSLGGEYSYNNQFFARAGYYWETKENGNRKYLTAGVGLKYSTFDLSFAYLAPSGSGLNRNPLSNTLRFGVIFDLASIANNN
ncbi:type IX secretion system outer membrane channel protein PorV [Rhizosphaericola mali]|uniref:Type IX secretion system outer membrane channel protein PorV n=1 Tax=Rhizosphaericola mali TaxID=2545455 RepID=A0A5P2FYD3_9BACT|nr:type IX secretion system outer membrane channel protein PorV [Rhizosphaericola mali]QES87947.1 type IX secretion system outer membrane channel protein PorV [Rhizosphaericola mali]